MSRLLELHEWFRSAPLGGKFRLSLNLSTPGVASVRLLLSEGDMVRGDKGLMVQGGVLAVLADAAAVSAAMSVLESGHTPLARLEMDFIAPTVPEDKELWADAMVVSETSRRIGVRFRVHGGGVTRASGTALFARPRRKESD